ncbi:NAD(P)H-dependent oxidoreductase [Psittacicella hinzii]|uniref:NAD(P)H-dependent oxidoreductase n=1 Tax=Psittacicella hinzii TaxID=2028575 RepID=A0A3A1YAL0_9GAMM|nr:NAD(P)H-dependent oxidoreductase [Psittacicella hinzii]RIY34376.1 NAD(P)H-dependent oxidoreductase [Psittacicella hinzii]
MTINKQQILDAYNWRAATKEYDPNKRVSREDMDFILETARLSPSSFGLEPWKFLVIERGVNPDLWNTLSETCWGLTQKLPGCSHVVIALSRRAADLHADSAYIDHLLRNVKKLPEDVLTTYRGFFANYAQNQANLLESDRAYEDWASKQTYIALGNMLTAAALIGVDSTPVEGIDYANIDKVLADKGLYDPEHFKVSVMAAFGYRAQDPMFPKSRQAAADVIEWVK